MILRLATARWDPHRGGGGAGGRWNVTMRWRGSRAALPNGHGDSRCRAGVSLRLQQRLPDARAPSSSKESRTIVTRRAGLLAPGSSYWLRLPAPRPAMAAEKGSGTLQRSSPVTAAGPQRLCTVFPILLPRPRGRADTRRSETGVILAAEMGLSMAQTYVGAINRSGGWSRAVHSR